MPELSADPALPLGSCGACHVSLSASGTRPPDSPCELTSRGPAQMRNKSLLTAAMLFPNDNSPRQLGRPASQNDFITRENSRQGQR